MKIKEGLIPTILGTAVTAAGMKMRKNYNVKPTLASTVVGFGLAHIVLGAIDLIEH